MAKQQWIEWHDCADHYVRTFVIRLEGETIPKDDLLYETYPAIKNYPHHLLGRLGLNYGTYFRHQYLVEFDQDVIHPPAIGILVGGERVSHSFSFAVFPYLSFPRWNKSGGRVVVDNTPPTRRWIKENLSPSALIINSSELLYVTSDDESDITLLKIRGGEFNHRAIYD